MLSRLILPPGFSVRIDYNPESGPIRNATFTVLKAGEWVGEVIVPVERLDHPDDLQDFADRFTKRGVRAVKEEG